MRRTPDFLPHDRPHDRAGKLNDLSARVESNSEKIYAHDRQIAALGGAPSTPGETPIDPGDLTVYFDNGLVG